MEEQLTLEDFDVLPIGAESTAFISCEADAIAAGLCCECFKKAVHRIYTKQGLATYAVTGICEDCQNKIFIN